MAGPLPQFEVKLEPGDTRASLMEKKLRAEMSFRQVSEEYHVVWLNCRDHSKNILAELEELKSLNLNGKLAQPPAAGVANSSEAYLDWLYASLERLQDRFGQFLQQLSQATGVEVKHAPLKQKKRVLEKAFYDYQGDYSRLVDICRGSGVAEDLAGVVKAMKWVLGHCHVVRFKNRFCDGRRDIMARGGYRDILVNLELAGGAGGFVFELQIHLRPLFAMKEEAHKVLDLARAVIEPTLLKLSLLDAQESHAQLVNKVKQLEQQVSGLTIEAAVQGQQGGQQVSDKDEEWQNKYQQLQQQYEQKCAKAEQAQQNYQESQQKYADLLREAEQSQQTCVRLQQELAQSQQKAALQQKEHEQNKEQLQQTISQLKTDANRRDAEIQALNEQLAPPSKPVSEESKGWWQDSYITGLCPPPPLLYGEALLPRVSELTSQIKLQPDDVIIFASFQSFYGDTFAITRRELFHIDRGWNILLSQIKECSLRAESSWWMHTLVIPMASGETKELRAWTEIAEFVKTVLMFAARGIKT